MAVVDHTTNVLDISFTPDDQQLVCATTEGYVFSYDIQTSTKLQEYFVKGFNAKCLAVGNGVM